MGRDLDARHELAGLDDGAVEGREDLERVDAVERLQVAAPDVQHAVRLGQQVDTALGRAALREPRPGDRLGQAERGLILVEVVVARQDGR